MTYFLKDLFVVIGFGFVLWNIAKFFYNISKGKYYEVNEK